MENRKAYSIFRCMKYWIACNRTRFFDILAVAFVLIFWAVNHFYHVGFFELAYIYLTGTASVTLFSLLNISLPFSRKELWDFHFWFQTILLGTFFICKIAVRYHSFVEILLIISLFFVIHKLEADIPKKPERTLFVVISYIIFVLCSQLLEMVGNMRMIDSIHGLFKITVLVAYFLFCLIVDVLYWKECRDKFLFGK